MLLKFSILSGRFENYKAITLSPQNTAFGVNKDGAGLDYEISEPFEDIIGYS